MNRQRLRVGKPVVFLSLSRPLGRLSLSLTLSLFAGRRGQPGGGGGSSVAGDGTNGLWPP